MTNHTDRHKTGSRQTLSRRADLPAVEAVRPEEVEAYLREAHRLRAAAVARSLKGLATLFRPRRSPRHRSA